MADEQKPGTNVGRRGGVYQEVGPRGGEKSNFATVADNRRLPPTTAPGHKWTPIKITPTSDR
jgi:hypothetical protein